MIKDVIETRNPLREETTERMTGVYVRAGRESAIRRRRARGAVTLYVDDDAIRLLILKGKKIAVKDTIRLEPGLIKDGLVTSPERLALILRGLLKEHRLRGGDMTVGISGRNSMTRLLTIPRVPDAVLPEAVQREAERELPVPLEDLYYSWQRLPPTGPECRVFLVAFQRRPTDSLMASLKLAGIRANILEMAPLALSRVAGKETAALVQRRPGELDIVIREDGLPLVVRSLPFEDVAPAEQFKAIGEEIGRTLDFYHTHHTSSERTGEIPIYFSGEGLGDDCEVRLASVLGRPILPLNSLLKPEYQVASLAGSYLVNIGLAAKSMEITPPSPLNLNALPDAYRRPLRPATRFIWPLAGLVIIALAGAAALGLRTAAEKTGVLQAELNNVRTRLAEEQSAQLAAKKETAGLEKAISEVRLSQERLQLAGDSLGSHRALVEGSLAAITGTAPSSSVRLDNIRYNETAVSVSGEAPTETHVLDYINRLKGSGYFTGVTVSRLSRNAADAMSFILTLKLEG